MRHLTPARIVRGAAMVILLTFVALLLAPGASGAAVALIAVGALPLGVLAAVVPGAGPRPAAAPARQTPADAPGRPGVRV
ncbi:hypothetical protein [Streptomyces specialis]|uniref:hypothetical protein n=1 Tax=Streptomyces specialis TaxID=498367 RepID=UPI00073F2D7B|nr:hypothetical protein [Streptomyces specialis]